MVLGRKRGGCSSSEGVCHGNDDNVDGIPMNNIVTATNTVDAVTDSEKETMEPAPDDKVLMSEIENVRFTAVKISNIAWEVTSGEIVEKLTLLPLKKIHVHIPIDRTTGKTKAEMYIELPSIMEGLRFAAKYNRSVLKGRAISVAVSSLEELIKAHFPSLFDDHDGSGESEIISHEEVHSLVNICRNYKVVHFLAVDSLTT